MWIECSLLCFLLIFNQDHFVPSSLSVTHSGFAVDGSGLTVGLLPGDTLNVDDVLLTVHLDNLALTASVLATNNNNLVVLADWHALDLRGRKTD